MLRSVAELHGVEGRTQADEVGRMREAAGEIQGTACPVCGARAPPVRDVLAWAAVDRRSRPLKQADRAFLETHLAAARAGFTARHIAAYHPDLASVGTLSRMTRRQQVGGRQTARASGSRQASGGTRATQATKASWTPTGPLPAWGATGSRRRAAPGGLPAWGAKKPRGAPAAARATAAEAAQALLGLGRRP